MFVFLFPLSFLLLVLVTKWGLRSGEREEVEAEEPTPRLLSSPYIWMRALLPTSCFHFCDDVMSLSGDVLVGCCPPRAMDNATTTIRGVNDRAFHHFTVLFRTKQNGIVEKIVFYINNEIV
jgi:hypothetical protein